eukprot:g12651.t1
MATAVAKGKRRGLLKVKPHRVKRSLAKNSKSLARKACKQMRNGRGLALNSSTNIRKELVPATARTIENSQKVMNRLKKEKKMPKRNAYREEKKRLRREAGASRAKQAEAAASMEVDGAKAAENNPNTTRTRATKARKKSAVKKFLAAGGVGAAAQDVEMEG